MLVRALGLKPYAQVWRLQKDLVDKRLRGEIPDTLLLVEHEPCYTRGASSKAHWPPELPYPTYDVERGGDITYHGPGQLVGYPIFDIERLGLTSTSYLRSLELVLIEALRPLGIEAKTSKGFTGVWVKDKKIASIGVAGRGPVFYHGFALNVCNDLTPFQLIHPCNLESSRMTSVHKLLGRPTDTMAALKHVADAFLAYFGCPVPAPGQ